LEWRAGKHPAFAGLIMDLFTRLFFAAFTAFYFSLLIYILFRLFTGGRQGKTAPRF
jgi:hypothetical protein